MDAPPAEGGPPENEAKSPSDAPNNTHDDYSKHRGSKGRFRLKSSSSRHRRRHGTADEKSRHEDHYERRRRRHRHKQRRESNAPANDHGEPPLSPRTAFRESLFDAMGDDEGASYWEGVYGQPIHNYSVPQVPTGPEGELEQMTEDEYAAYVRARMWERTREGMEEAQAQARAERMRQRKNEEQGRTAERERAEFERAMDESLRRGRERKRKRTWEGLWGNYLKSWEEIARVVASATGSSSADEKKSEDVKPLRNLLFWPVESGKRRDVAPASVEEFMRHAPPPQEDLLSVLKTERVRWHPDKIQHRYGVLGIDEVVMRSVTEVFQIVDRMWSEERAKV
ncbi:hypothetical protein N7474_011138 [Penicillium riverlandense]|uniref:uncharacterized protein n=1 Tax=Penicillium riverlandense TaxID=1903569 RepID=UPI0025472261|nr:uncharacterized protein N7474_011138 [Penicillium riverlandense]KAJ5805251.1 hypothetical protein N7474_011138 [Penicillium riverlandense]